MTEEPSPPPPPPRRPEPPSPLAVDGADRQQRPHRRSPRSPPHHPQQQPPAQPDAGGRLKFFKDGKFILELAQGRSRDGERPSWVAVSRKPFWAGASPSRVRPATPGGAHRSERAASLSVSDDNSSVQSSPWQRDHRWKQSAPQRHLSAELAGCYVRAADRPPAALLASAAARRKRRRPFDAAAPALNGCATNGANGDSHSLGKFKCFELEGDEPKERPPLRVYRKSRRAKRRQDLFSIVRTLADKLPPAPPPLTVNAKTSNLSFFRRERAAMVSPRKRILREMQRVSLAEEESRRSRATSSPSTSSSTRAGPSEAQPATTGHFNGGAPRKTARRETPPMSKAVCNYSINSLLSKGEDSNALKPYNNPNTPRKIDSPPSGSAHSPDSSSLSPPDAADFRHHHHGRNSTARPLVPYSFGGGGSPGPSSSASPRPPEKYYHHDMIYAGVEDSPIPYHHHHQHHHHPHLYQPTAYLPHPAYLGASYAPPPFPPHHHHGHPSPLWALPRPFLPDPWGPLAHTLLAAERSPREEASSDLPLNLSKH